jgi:hypothetical protein
MLTTARRAMKTPKQMVATTSGVRAMVESGSLYVPEQWLFVKLVGTSENALGENSSMEGWPGARATAGRR